MRILDHLNQHDRNVRGSIMTTFPFSARFFESAFLPLLRQKSTGDANVVLVDDSTYEATFNENDLEMQPTSAGKRYYLTPMCPQSGRTFHPKIYFFGGERTATAYIGSANLTQQALTRNQEIMSVVHCTNGMLDEEDDRSSLYDTTGVITEVADFLAALFDCSVADRVGPVARESAEDTLDAIDWVRAAASEMDENRSRWFLHNLEEPMLGQVFDIIDDREDEIAAADVAAPFYGNTVDVLEEFIESGIETTVWLQDQQTQVDEMALKEWYDREPAAVKTYSHTRYVHGKVLVLRTTGATYVFGGSPNLSRAALLASATEGGEPGNVESAVLRRITDRSAEVFETEPFDRATSGLGGFQPAEKQAPGEEEDSEENANEALPVRLLVSDLVVYESYDGGKLTISADVAQSEATRPCTLLLKTEDATKRVLKIGTKNIERSGDIGNDRDRLTIEKSLLTKSDLKPLRNGGKVRLEWRDNVVSNPCWLNVHTPSYSQEAESAAEDRGAKLVPLTLPELYLGDENEQGEVLSALNSFLEAMSQRWDDPSSASDQSSTTREEDAESPRGGLRIREWSASSNHDDPVNSYEAVYQEWLQDIKWLIQRFEREPVDIIAEVGLVLKAINRSNILILVLEDLRRGKGGSVENLAVQSPRNVIKDIYTQRRLDGQLESHLATLLDLVQLQIKREPDQADQLYDAIHENIYPNTLLASIVARKHIADSFPEYYRQQDWAFEELLYQHFPDEDSLTAEISSSSLEASATAVLGLLEGIDEIINRSSRLKRHAAQDYLNEMDAQQAIRSRLASTMLYAGPETVAQYREEFGHVTKIEDEIKLNKEWLP